jgi:2-polyprenyl-6-methoxyphenol hydroxylase-like FAD-dependent oxidoreductase
MSDRRTALIIGAGIGGLAAGLSLRRAGWDIRIHERATSPRELGFGLGLAPNALSALHELGVAEHVVRAGARLAKIELRRANGRVLRRFNVKVGLPAVVALRSDLHGALLAAVGDDALRLSSEAVSFSESRRGVTVHFSDGSADTGTILIGADGVHSTIRKRLHPNERSPRPSGFCAVRGVAYGVGDYLGGLSGVGYLDDAIEAATVRASSNADAVYWYMSLRSQDVTDPGPMTILNQRCRDFEPALRAILLATKPDDMRFDHLFQRDALRTWGVGHVTLLGDAAHLLMPHTGQGAAQALEDAVALGLAMAGSGSVEQALRRYEAVRSRRTRAFIRLGPRIARVTTTSNVVIKAVRSLALRLTPERLLALSARGFQRDPHRELRSRPAA